MAKCSQANPEEKALKPAPRRDLITARQGNVPIGMVMPAFNRRITRFENYVAREH